MRSWRCNIKQARRLTRTLRAVRSTTEKLQSSWAYTNGHGKQHAGGETGKALLARAWEEMKNMLIDTGGG